jgi:hypothetical protein
MAIETALLIAPQFNAHINRPINKYTGKGFVIIKQ